MKTSFWSLGVSDTAGAELAGLASRWGFDGVDIRCTRSVDGRPGGGGNVCLDTPEDELKAFREAFEERNVEIANVLCYGPGGHAGSYDWDWYKEDVAAHAQVALSLGARRLRPTAGHPKEGQSWEDYLSTLFGWTVAGLADTPLIQAVFENHPGSASCGQLLAAAERFGNSQVGVIFSPDHVMTMQEQPLKLIATYAPHIAEISYADRKVVQEDLARFDGHYYYVQYESCVIGEGDVPHAEIFAELIKNGFDDYVALKWEKTENYGHHLPPFDEVAPHFVPFVRSYAEAGR